MDAGQFRALVVALHSQPNEVFETFNRLVQTSTCDVVLHLFALAVADAEKNVKAMSRIILGRLPGMHPAVRACVESNPGLFFEKLYALFLECSDDYLLSLASNVVVKFAKLFRDSELMHPFLGKLFESVDLSNVALAVAVVNTANDLLGACVACPQLDAFSSQMFSNLVSNIAIIDEQLVLACFRCAYTKFGDGKHECPELATALVKYLCECAVAKDGLMERLLHDLSTDEGVEFVMPVCVELVQILMQMLPKCRGTLFICAGMLLFEVLSKYSNVFLSEPHVHFISDVVHMAIEILAVSEPQIAIEGELFKGEEAGVICDELSRLISEYTNRFAVGGIWNSLWTAIETLDTGHQMAVMAVYLCGASDIEEITACRTGAEFARLTSSMDPHIRFVALKCLREYFNECGDGYVCEEAIQAVLQCAAGEPVPEVRMMAVVAAGVVFNYWGASLKNSAKDLLSSVIGLLSAPVVQVPIAISQIMVSWVLHADYQEGDPIFANIMSFFHAVLEKRSQDMNRELFFACLSGYVRMRRKIEPGQFDRVTGETLQFIFSQDSDCFSHTEWDLIKSVLKRLTAAGDAHVKAMMDRMLQCLVQSITRDLPVETLSKYDARREASQYVEFQTGDEIKCYYKDDVEALWSSLDTLNAVIMSSPELILPYIEPLAKGLVFKRLTEGDIGIFQALFQFLTYVSPVLDCTQENNRALITFALLGVLRVLQDVNVPIIDLGLDAILAMVDSLGRAGGAPNDQVIAVVIAQVLSYAENFARMAKEELESDKMVDDSVDYLEYEFRAGMIFIELAKFFSPIALGSFSQLAQRYPLGSSTISTFVWTAFCLYSADCGADVMENLAKILLAEIGGQDPTVQRSYLILILLLVKSGKFTNFVPAIVERISCLLGPNELLFYTHRALIPLLLHLIVQFESTTDVTPVMDMLVSPALRTTLISMVPDTSQDFITLLNSSPIFKRYMTANPTVLEQLTAAVLKATRLAAEKEAIEAAKQNFLQ